MTKFESALMAVCEGWIGHELGYEEYIRANAKALLKIANEEGGENERRTESKEL